MRDLVGIGALNVDYIATRERLQRIEPSLQAELAERFEYGSEKPVDEGEINETLNQMGLAAFDVCLGGSSFNTIQALAALDPGISLGFVGVAGITGSGAPKFGEWFRHHRVDDSFVLNDPSSRAGTCISYINDGERSLLTWPGANVRMAEHLGKNFDIIIRSLSEYKVIHISSFFDDNTPAVLLRVIESVKRLNPTIKISYDPGHHWVETMTPEIRGLLVHTDYLFLNDGEFRRLGHHRPGTTDRSIASKIFDASHSGTILIVLKRYDGVTIFSKLADQVIEHRQANIVLRPEKIEDATGAGDVFAAGFLAATLIPGLELSHGVKLGLELVRTKLTSAGTSSFRSFHKILNDFLERLIEESAARASANQEVAEKSCMVLSSKASSFGLVVAKHIKDNYNEYIYNCSILKYDCDPEDFIQLMDTYTFVIFDLTDDKEPSKFSALLTPDAIHKIGLLQGKLGLGKVLILTKDSTASKMPDIDLGPTVIKKGESPQDVLERIDVVLRRESILPSLPAVRPATLSDDVAFSDDFRSVNWNGRTFTFTDKQSKIVKTLWDNWKKKTPDVAQRTLLNSAESEALRVIDIFRRNEAWGVVITKGRRKGTLRLNLKS